MLKSHLFSLALLALLAFVICPARAATAPKTPAAPPDVRKLIQSVDPKETSVTILNNRDKSTHTYKIDDLTKLTINNQDKKFADIKTGMVVDDLLERDNDDLDGLSLSGSGGPLTPPTAKTKTPAKPAAKPAQ